MFTFAWQTDVLSVFLIQIYIKVRTQTKISMGNEKDAHRTVFFFHSMAFHMFINMIITGLENP